MAHHGPDAGRGRQADVQVQQTAPHITKYFRTYISKDSYDPKVGLRWSDLELIGDSGWMDRPVDDKISKLDVKIPAQYTGKRVIYTVWQRDPSDAKEGFYCARMWT